MSRDEDRRKTVTTDTLQAIADAFNRYDLDGVMALLADDAVFEAPKGPEPRGRRYVGATEVRQGIGVRLADIPDVHDGDDSHRLSGDRGVSEWTLTGTRQTASELLHASPSAM